MDRAIEGSVSRMKPSSARRSGRDQQDIHLVVREGRPDLRPGIAVAGVHGHRTQADAGRGGDLVAHQREEGTDDDRGSLAAVAQHPGRDPVDEALAPAGALHDEHPRPVDGDRLDGIAAGPSGTWRRVRPSGGAAPRAGRGPSLAHAGHRDHHELQVVDACVVVGVGRVQRQPVRDRCRRDERIERTRRPASVPTSGSDAATRPNARAAARIERSGSKSASACWRCACRAARSVSVAATSGPTASSAKVTALIRGTSGRSARSTQPGQQDQHVRIEDSLGCHQSDWSMRESMSVRSPSHRPSAGGTTGRATQARPNGARRRGASWATGLPSLVTISCSPRSTRSMTSPP